MPIQKNDSDASDEPTAMRPIDELPPPGDDDPPPGSGVRIFSVSPIAGALAGGIPVTITGTGFQPGAEVFFGGNQSAEVAVESGTSARATLPPAAEVGSVNVTLVNPDGTSATRAGGFTYVVTGTGARAEVLGVAPLSVIEDTESEVTLRGRNLIEAHTNGMLALRGPTRVQVTSTLLTSGRDEATGVEELTFTVSIVAAPPLEQQERVAVQVLASVRPGSLNDGIPESSRKMFTVLPRAVPVPIAFTDRLEPGKANLVVVAGRNLEGCVMSVGEGATLHVQRGDEQTLVALVTVSGGSVSDNLVSGDSKSLPTAQLLIHKEGGAEVARLDMTVAPNEDSLKASAAASAEGGEVTASAAASVEPGAGDIGLNLTPIPGQQIFGPTAEDSSVFRLGGGSLANFGFDFGEFEFLIFHRTFVFSIFNEVRLIPFFDDGAGDALGDTPVAAQVGKLFRLRGMGLLVALRVELVITIEIVIIIGFRFNIWPFGLFNEFYDDYPFGIGSFVITFRLVILIEINFNISFLVALVRPGGQLRVLSFFHLTIGIDLTISTDGRTLHFDPDFDMDVDYTRVGPRGNNLRPCGGRFQLADDNGQTEFTNAVGDHHSFYFVHAPGECCLPWDFDLRLVRYRPGSDQRETVQESFRADFCLNAAPSPVQLDVIVVSNRTPTGYPPPLVLDVTETASLKALARQRDEAGNPVPTSQLRDVTELGYQVEFFIEPSPEVLDREALRQGTAIGQATGNNTIHARLFKTSVVIIDPETGEEIPNALWPGGVLGFDILGFLAQGLPPAVRYGSLPVQVNAPQAGEIVVDVRVARKDSSSGKLVPVNDLVRNEPFETQQPYVLAARVSLGTGVQPSQTLTFNVSTQMTAPFAGLPSSVQFTRNRTGTVNDPTLFFSGEVVAGNVAGTLVINSGTDLGEYHEVKAPANPQNQSPPFSLKPNNVEGPSGAATLTALVPPGRNVTGSDTKLTVAVNVTASNATVRVAQSPFDVTVSNEETFEEYLRVFQEVQEILNPSGLKDFASTFYTGLKGQGVDLGKINTYLAGQGATLWGDAVAEVQAHPTSPDDRPLYWTRLRCIAALRAYFKINFPGGLPQSVVNQFEFPSRGLETDGSISFGALPPAARKAIFTGFDPFSLPSRIRQSNPSGLAALAFNNKDFGGTNTQARVRTAVIPVRYDDFDRNVIEGIARSTTLDSVEMFMTCSDNSGREFYDVERWAARTRLTGIPDNNRDIKTDPNPRGAAAAGPEFLESTLPYELVIVTDTDALPGPSGNTPFVADQSYSIRGGKPNTAGQDRPEPKPGDPDKTAWFTKLPEKPISTGISESGSGGNYLSNEIFYRVALARGARTVATGHLHVPSTGTDPAATGRALTTGVTQALNRLLDAAIRPRLRSVPDLAFSPTLVNHSRTLTLTATNATTETITVKAAEVASPFTAGLPGAAPIQVSPGGTLTLTLTFTPTSVKQSFVAAVRVRDKDDKFVLACTLVGEGVQTLPAPQITSFDPHSGVSGQDSVTITGKDFEDTSEVKIANVAVPVSSVTPTEVVAEVTGIARKGKIKLTTPGGTATSADDFTVTRPIIIRPPEELGALLRARREELGIERSEAAQQLGVTRSSYARWERGEDIPRPRYRPAITSFLGRVPGGEPQTLGERIRSARERDGLSTTQLAQRLAVSSSTIRAWEADEVSRPTPRVARIFEDYVKEE
jgi:transcriptional regulator with XRE-family HTH domain